MSYKTKAPLNKGFFMELRSTLFLTLTTLMIAANSFATDNVAKVVIMRGMVKAKLTDGTVIDVKADQSIPEGAVVQTAEKKFCEASLHR